MTRGLKDEAAITVLLSQYCERIDRYDIDGVAACFADDAVADYGPGRGGRVEGRDAIAKRIAEGQAEFRRTHHQLGQIQITLRGNTADSCAYTTAHHERWDGSRHVVALRYVDTLTRAAGEWVIAERRVEAAWVDGFPGVEWNWVEREPAADDD